MQKPDNIREDPSREEEQEISLQLVVVLEERKSVIAKEIKSLISADFWEIRTIPRTVIEPLFEPDMVMRTN